MPPGWDGSPCWAWDTTDTEVRLGLTERPDDASGPRLSPGMTWFVSATDDEGRPIASSVRAPIAP